MKSKTIRALISLVLSVSLLASIGVSVMATGGAVVYPGGGDYFTDLAQETDTIDDAWVHISKTAVDSSSNPILGEDEFEITLVAETKENLEEFLIVKDTQVLLVLDTSLSMTTYCAECGKTYATGKNPCCSHPETRLDRTKKAVASFLDSYAASAAGTTAHRYVAVVEYGIQARYYQPNSSNKINAWIDVNPLNTGGTSRLTSLKSWVNSLTTTAGTNTDAALAMADALLNNAAFNPYQSVENKNLVLFTDGMPNMRLTANQVLTANGNNPSPYPFPNNAGSAGTQVAYEASKPTQSNQQVYQQPLTKAAAIRNKGINIFTVGYGGDGGTGSTDVYLTGWRAALQWLETLASSPQNAYVVDAVSSLNDMVRSFVEIVEWAVWEGISPYVITDPMGPYVMWDADNTLDSNIGQSFAQNSFVWDLKKAPLPVKDSNGWYSYSYTYKVTFDADRAYEDDYSTAFDHSTGAPLNEPTTLTFAKLVNNEISGTVQTVDYKLPTAAFATPSAPVASKYPYTVNYYIDSVLGSNLIGSTPGITDFEDGYALTNSDVSADLGADWLDAKKPSGYTFDSANYVTITTISEDNVVTVVYVEVKEVEPEKNQTVSLGWMRSSELKDARFLKAVGERGDAWTYQEVFDGTPIKYFENEEVRAVANEKAAQGTENTTSAGQQLVGIKHIWDDGTYFDKYKAENGNVGFDWASWIHFGQSGTTQDKGEYSIRRFAAYFDFSAEDLANASSIMLAPEDELGNMSYLFPINDNAFVFVNGQLAFWGGTDVVAGQNQYGALNRTTFMGKEGISVRDGVNGVFKHLYPHTDGWCIDLETNAKAVNIKSLLKPGFNRIDIVTDEYWEGGGMNKLSLFIDGQKNTDKDNDAVFMNIDFIGHYYDSANVLRNTNIGKWHSVEIGKPAEINWDAVYAEYAKVGWLAANEDALTSPWIATAGLKLDESQIIGWRVSGVSEIFEGARPNIIFSTEMQERYYSAASGSYVTYLVPVCATP